MKNSKSSRVWLAALLFTVPALPTVHAQDRSQLGSIEVLVRDARTDLPLGYTVLHMVQPELERFTDSHGRIVVAALAPGAYSVTIRRLGFVPVTKTIDVIAGAPAPLTVRLDRVPQQLSRMEVSAAVMCAEPGIPDSTRSPGLHSLVSLLRENAERYRLLVKQYPFVGTQARAFGDLRDSVVFVQSVEVNEIPARTRVEYRTGRVVTRRQNRYSMMLPTLLDLADDGFARTHCFTYGGTTRNATDSGEETWVRLDVRADDKLKAPDVHGTFYLDSATAQLRKMDVELSRTDLLPRQLDAIASVRSSTRFVEIASGLSVIRSVCAVTRLRPETKESKSALDAMVPTELQQYANYRFAKAPPDMAPLQSFDVQDWMPQTYMPRTEIWCAE